MKTRFFLVPLLIAATAALAACGGGGSKGVPSDAVAVVGSTPITKTQFDNLMKQAEAQAKAAGQPVPKLGTPQYTQLRDHVLAYLVQNSEFQQEGDKLGVKVTPADVNAYLQSIAKLHYNGSQKKLDAAIQKSGMTMDQARYLVTVNLLQSKIKTKVTSQVKVTPAEEQQNYNQNKASYHMAQSRSVRQILVSSKSEANMIEAKLKNGASFASLAKKYSKDPGTAAVGGKYTAVEGQDVPTFDKAAFKLKTGQVSAPVKSPYGWHIILALGPTKPAHTIPFKQAQSQIEQNLLAQKQQTVWGTWLTNLQKKYQGKVQYQAGYQPATTATTPAPAPTTT